MNITYAIAVILFAWLMTGMIWILGSIYSQKRRQLILNEIQKYEDKVLQEKMASQARRILRFPVIEMTVDDFKSLPQGVSIDLHTCPLGTRFICKPFSLTPEITVIGQVVAGMEMFADQWGAGISVPERGINRYRLKLV